MATTAGTSGGWRGMNGTQLRLAAALGGGFFAVLIVIMVANATSMVADFREAHIDVSTPHVWLFEASSIIAWVTTLPFLWWLVALLARARLSWWWVALIVAAATVPVSAWHIALMWAIRAGVYAIEGQRYSFMGGMPDPFLYEYRKDVATILQFMGMALVAQWLIARAGTIPGVVEIPQAIEVADGATTHRVPVREIERVAAAGNYVEIGWRLRPLLHRATLAAVEEQLGPAFVRIHRGQLVRRDAIRRIETDKSGDFTVTLESGSEVRGSRRYRAGLAGGGGV